MERIWSVLVSVGMQVAPAKAWPWSWVMFFSEPAMPSATPLI